MEVQAFLDSPRWQQQHLSIGNADNAVIIDTYLSATTTRIKYPVLFRMPDQAAAKKVTCFGKGCSVVLRSGAYRIDVIGKITLPAKDGAMVDKVFHFCPSPDCFTNPKSRATQTVPQLEANSIRIVVDPTITITTTERTLLQHLNLIELTEGEL